MALVFFFHSWDWATLRFELSSCRFTLIPMPNFDSPRPTPAPPIASEKVLIERKTFFLDLKENHRGRVLKITEDVGGRRNTIMLPAEAFGDFVEALGRLVEFEAKL